LEGERETGGMEFNEEKQEAWKKEKMLTERGSCV
jgi:hypothetical protein